MTITLSTEFEAPLALSRLYCLLLLSVGLRAHLPPLRKASEPDSPPEWHEIIDHFAVAFARKVGYIEEPSEALDIFDLVLKGKELRNINHRSRSILSQVRETIGDFLRHNVDPLDYLEDANEEAHAWLVDVLRRNNVSEESVPPIFPIVIKADFANRWHCASTSRQSRRINFFLQTDTHSLWAGLAVGTIFRHEYLSHLIPASSFLGSTVTEGWLFSTLLTEMLVADVEDGPLERLVTLRFRRELLANIATNLNRSLYAEGTEAIVALLRSKCRTFFWAMNSDILRINFDRGEARDLTRIIFELLHVGERELDALCGEGWRGVREVAQRFNLIEADSEDRKALTLVED